MQIQSKLVKYFKTVREKNELSIRNMVIHVSRFSKKRAKPYDRQVIVVKSIQVLLHINLHHNCDNGRFMGLC